MTIKTNVLLCVLAATMIAPGVAHAGNQFERSDRGPKRMERLDTNKDGAISLKEMTAQTTERFSSADADDDGTITVEELTEHLQRRAFERRARHMLARLDYDGDGKVTVSELENRAAKRFALMDANDDGQVSAQELRASKRFAKRHRKGNRHRGHGR